MKKALFATTALVAGALATPQVASAQSVSAGNADISFGGYARWGLRYDDSAAQETNITSRWRLQIDATAESDAGIVFGARARIQRNSGASNTSTATDSNGDTVSVSNGGFGVNAARFFIRTGGLEVGVGNIQGAIEFMPGQYPIDLGLTGLGYDYTAYQFNADGYSSGGDGASNRNGIEVVYNAGDFGVHLSASDGAGDRIALAVDYTVAGWTLAAGIQDSSNAGDTEWTVSAGGDIGPANVTFAYADNGTNGEVIVLAGRFDVSATTNIEAYIADADAYAEESYGIDFNTSMGGGTSLRGGIVSRGSGATQADFGVRFNF